MADARKTMQIVIEAKDEATQTFHKVGNEAKGFGGGITGVGLALTAVAGGFAFLGKQMIDSAARFEQTRVAFSNMLGSAAQANTLLKQLEDFANITPFDLPEVEAGARSLLAYGTAAADIIPQMTMLGTAASLTKVPLNQMVNAFGQVQVKGKLMGQEVLQFFNAGIPITKLLAESMGKTTNEISKMIEQGKIGYNDLNKVMEANYGQASKNGKLMEEQSKTFLGRVSNIRGAWEVFLRIQGQGLLVFANMAVDKLAQILNWLQADAKGFNYVGRTIYGLITFFKALGLMVNAVIKTFVGFGATIIDVAKLLYALVKDGINNFKSFGTQLQSVFRAIGQAMTGNFTEAGNTIKTMFAGALQNTTAEFNRFSVNNKATTDFVGQAWGQAAGAVGEFFTQSGFTKIKTEYGKLGEAATKATNDIVEGSKKGTDEAKKMADKLTSYADKVKGTFNEVNDAMGATKTKIVEITDKLNELMVKQAKDELGMRKDYATAYVEQEQKVSELKANIAKEDDADKRNQLQSQLQREQEALNAKKTIEIAYLNEVKEARRIAGLTEFERQIEELNQKQILMAQDYEVQRKKLEGELKMELAKYAKLKEIQDEAQKQATRFLLEGERQTVDSVNREIQRWNALAAAISRAKSGTTSNTISGADINQRLTALGNAKAINVTIQGNTFLDDKSAEKVGNLLVNKLKQNTLLP